MPPIPAIVPEKVSKVPLKLGGHTRQALVDDRVKHWCVPASSIGVYPRQALVCTRVKH